MNTDVKKKFMIELECLKQKPCLRNDEDDVEAAWFRYSHYSDKLADNKNILLLMGMVTRIKTITQTKYMETEEAMQALNTITKNVFVGYR